jgi:hypothetical protein
MSHRRERGSTPEEWAKATEKLEEGNRIEAARVARLLAHLKTLPAKVSGFDINPENGEVTDNIGNFVLTVSIGDTIEDVHAEIEAWFECC